MATGGEARCAARAAEFAAQAGPRQWSAWLLQADLGSHPQASMAERSTRLLLGARIRRLPLGAPGEVPAWRRWRSMRLPHAPLAAERRHGGGGVRRNPTTMEEGDHRHRVTTHRMRKHESLEPLSLGPESPPSRLAEQQANNYAAVVLRCCLPPPSCATCESRWSEEEETELTPCKWNGCAVEFLGWRGTAY